jgi:hypothetical protein
MALANPSDAPQVSLGQMHPRRANPRRQSFVVADQQDQPPPARQSGERERRILSAWTAKPSEDHSRPAWQPHRHGQGIGGAIRIGDEKHGRRASVRLSSGRGPL